MCALLFRSVPERKENQDVISLSRLQVRAHVTDQCPRGVCLVNMAVIGEMWGRFAFDVQPYTFIVRQNVVRLSQMFN